MKERILAIAVGIAVVFACELSRGAPIRHTTSCHWPLMAPTPDGQVIYYYPNSRSVYDVSPWFSDSPPPSWYWLHVSFR